MSALPNCEQLFEVRQIGSGLTMAATTFTLRPDSDQDCMKDPRIPVAVACHYVAKEVAVITPDVRPTTCTFQSREDLTFSCDVESLRLKPDFRGITYTTTMTGCSVKRLVCTQLGPSKFMCLTLLHLQ